MAQLVSFKFNGLTSLTPPPSAGPRGVAAVVPVGDVATVDTSLFSVEYCLSQGLTIAPTIVTTAARPTTNLSAGMMIIDSTLNTPIWRDATNTKWISATGATV